MKKLHIVLRTCEGVDAFSGSKRMFPKRDVILRCLSSLITSLAYSMIAMDKIHIQVIDDSSSDDFLKEVESRLKILNTSNYSYTIQKMTGLGNSGSLKECYKYADSLEDNTLIFFLEDDYLFYPKCIEEMLYLYQKTGEKSNYILHPVDYPDRYKNIYECQVILGKSFHWRTIKHTTGTFMIPKSVFSSHRDKYEKFTEYGITPGINEDNSINLVYEDVPCLSPLPTLGHHFQYESTLSPLVDWKQLWETNK